MEKDTKPNAWFFAEWFSIIGTFMVCFVFLFYQNQAQSARTDKLYEMFYEVVKEKK
jgi:hypothetical protein